MKSLLPPENSPCFLARFLALSCAFSFTCSAATFNYTATSGTNLWSTGTGWNAVPVSNVDTVLQFGPVINTGTNISSNDLSTFSLNQINFNQVAHNGNFSNQYFAVSGNTLHFQPNSSSVNPSIIATAPGSNPAKGELRNDVIITGTLTMTSLPNTFYWGGDTVNLTGFTAGVTSGTGSIVTPTGQTPYFTGNNTYSGGTTVNNTVRIVGSTTGGPGAVTAGPLGTGTITMNNNGSIVFGKDFINATIDNAIVMNGTFNSFGTPTANAGNLSLGGNITLNATTVVSVNVHNDKVLSLTGNIGESGGARALTLRVNNQPAGVTPIVELSGNNTFTGGLTLRREGAGSLSGITLAIGHNNALGTGNFTIGALSSGSGTISVVSTNGTARTMANRLGTINDDVTFGAASGPRTGNLTFTNTQSTSLGSGTGITRTFTVNNTTAIASQFTSTNNLAKAGPGTLILSGTNLYTGTTLVNAGTLIINGNNSGATGAVTVAGGATLGGSGTVGGATTINGIHSPGNSPGTQNFAAGLSYTTGSSFSWELAANALVTRGTQFDGVNVTGGTLTIGTGVTSNLIFNGSGSTVNWSDAFWSTSQTWLVYDNANLPTLASGSIFDTVNTSLDSLGQSLASVRAGSTFAWNQTGNDVYLTYTAVPEPTSFPMVLGGLAALVMARRTRRNR